MRITESPVRAGRTGTPEQCFDALIDHIWMLGCHALNGALRCTTPAAAVAMCVDAGLLAAVGAAAVVCRDEMEPPA